MRKKVKSLAPNSGEKKKEGVGGEWRGGREETEKEKLSI